MVERLPQHRHCRNCEKAIPFKEEFCDEKCESEYRNKLLKKKRQLQYFYALMAIIFILAMSLVFFGSS